MAYDLLRHHCHRQPRHPGPGLYGCTGLKSGSAFPVTHKSDDITSVTSNGGKVRCMLAWSTTGKKKFETLSYLPNLTQDQLAKQIAYLQRKGWIACIEFQLQNGFVYREHHCSPGYHDGRYWTMWKLPMFRGH